MARQPLLTRTETKLQSTAEQSNKRHQRPCAEITVRKLNTSQIPTSLPHFDECAKQIPRNPPPPRANRAFKYHKNPHIPPPWPGVGGSGFQLISALQPAEIELKYTEMVGKLAIHPIQEE